MAPRTTERSTTGIDWALAGVLLVAFCALAVSRSALTDFTGDELWTRSLTRLPIGDTWPFIVRDGKHPPLFPLLSMLGGAFLPDTPLGLRSISILAAGLMPAAMLLLARGLGAPRLAAIVAALFIGAHEQMRAHAVDARSYELFALLILLHAGFVARAVMRSPSLAAAIAGVVAAASVMTHAFGIIFVAANCLAVLLLVRGLRPPEFAGASRSLLVAHLPAALLFAAWYGYVLMASRGTTGITAGLEWVVPQTMGDRVFSIGEVLGSAPYPSSTRITFLLWAAVAGAMWHGTRRNAPLQLATFAAWGALLLPLIAQHAASGLVADLPISGTKHVMAVVGPIALAVALLSRLPGVGVVLPRVAAASLALFAATSLATGEQSGSRLLSETVRRYTAVRDSAAVIATYAYGDLSILNFYLDPRCLDEQQLREQFNDVKGPPDFTNRSDACVASPGTKPIGPEVRRLFLAWRPAMPKEVALKDSIVASGWRLVDRRTAARHPTIVDELERRSTLATSTQGQAGSR